MKKMKTLLAGVLLAMGMASAAYAIPSLQLDIVGGTYDSGTETIVASSNAFTLNALLLPDSVNTTGATYFISAALIPKDTDAGDYGFFKIGSTEYKVTDDMVFGTPPIAAAFKDLAGHDIFDTWYTEISFMFPSTQYTPYNSQDDPGTTPAFGTGMFVKSFDIDLSGLNPDVGIHFDLYNSYMKDNGKYGIDNAPFSHDAEGTPGAPVPEPGTMMLLGVGMFGLAIFGKRRMNK